MQERSTLRLAALAVALMGAAAIQGCAVTTGIYVPDRSPVASHSMLSHYDKRFDMRYAEPTGGVATGSALHMPREPQTGALYFHFY